MKKIELIPFSQDSKYGVECTLELLQDYLAVSFRLYGDISQVIIPEQKDIPTRKYDLWEQTCFELFLKHHNNNWYLEFNLAPSGDWNCFYLLDYRNNCGEYGSVKEIPIETQQGHDYCLRGKIRLNEIPFTRDEFFTSKMLVGASSVLLKKDQQKEFLAITHLKDRPDFHDFDSFVSSAVE